MEMAEFGEGMLAISDTCMHEPGAWTELLEKEACCGSRGGLAGPRRLALLPPARKLHKLRDAEHDQGHEAGHQPNEEPVVVDNQRHDGHHSLEGWAGRWDGWCSHRNGGGICVHAGRESTLPTSTQAAAPPNHCMIVKPRATHSPAHQHDLHGGAKPQEVAAGVAARRQRHQVGLRE